MTRCTARYTAVLLPWLVATCASAVRTEAVRPITNEYRSQTRDDRESLILRLINVANTDPGDRIDSPKEVAMMMLGDLRAKEGVDVLAQHIAWWPGAAPRPGALVGAWVDRGGRTVDQMYVAAWSLAEIGMPSVPAMLKNLAESDDEKVRDRSAWVVNKVFMGKKAAARVFLEDAIKEAKDDKQRERLVAARKFFRDSEQ